MRKIKFIAALLIAICLAGVSNAQVKVACVGNSITYGTGIENREVNSYPAQLQKMLGDGYVVGNFGKPGATLLNHGHRPYTKQVEYKDALEFAGDIVVFHLGINDTDPRNWPNYRDEFVGDYLSLIQDFRDRNPKARIIMARMTPISDRHPRFISGTSQWHEMIQRAIETVAEVAGAELIDFHAPLYPYQILFPDGLHPDAEGAGIMAKVVYSEITGNYGGLKLPALYADGMVLQRDTPIIIRGTADAGTKIEVAIAGQKLKTTTSKQGKWQVELKPMKVMRGARLTITAGKEKRVFNDVAVGEVWLCSGQSNMAFRMNECAGAADDIKNSKNADIRLFDMKARWETGNVEWAAEVTDSVNHLQYYKPTTWKKADPETVAKFSAVAYYYGKMLQDSLKVPVGLICNAIGGSTTESWIDRHTLEYEFPAILRDWTNNDFVQDWARGRAKKNMAKNTAKFLRHPYEPCYLFESGILPLEQYNIKGVIWYQGESNAHNIEAHETLFTLLVNSWRKNWNNPEMPFYFVQLSSLNRPSWPRFRDSQRQLAENIPYAGMAVSSDVGDSTDVHPRKKQPVGERLARQALNKTYGIAITPAGPQPKLAVADGDKVIVTFDCAEGMHPSNGNEIITFEVAHYDGLFHKASAEVVGNTIVLTCPEVKGPRFVRYGWQPFTRANLVNGEGLPASSFLLDVAPAK